MYFENGRISSLQLYRMIVTEFLGFAILTASYLGAKYCGRDGIIAILLGGVIALLYNLLMFYIRSKMSGSIFEVLEKSGSTLWKDVISVVFIIKYVALAITGVILISNTVQRLLLSCYHTYIIIIPILFLMLYSFTLDEEGRGRFFEVAYYWVLFPAFFLIVLVAHRWDRFNITPLFMGNWKNTLSLAFVYGVIASPGEMLLFKKKSIIPDKETKNAIIKACIVITLISALYFLLNVGIYGLNGYINGDYLLLLQTVGHMESVTSLFVIISLFSFICCFAKEIVSLSRNIYTGKNLWPHRTIITLAIGVGSILISVSGMFVSNINEVSATPDIEEKDYITAFGIDYSKEQYHVWYQLSQGKNVYWSGKNILTSKEEYSYITGGNPDFSRVEVIVLGENILRNREALKNISSFIKSQDSIGKDTIIVSTENKATDLEKITGYDIYKMFDNNLNFYKSHAYEFVNTVSDKYKCLSIPIVTSKDKRPECVGITLINGRGTKKDLDSNESKLISLCQEKLEGQTFSISDKYFYKILDNNYYVKINIIGENTIGVNIRLTGNVKALSENLTDKETQNDNISEAVASALYETVEQNTIDFLRVYDRLSVIDRKLWFKYMSDRRSMFENVYFNVESKFRIID